MEKEFVPYELALRMKQLGFDEKCFRYYQNGFLMNDNPYLVPKNSHLLTMEKECSAPIYSQAFRWFREKHNLHVNKTGNSNYTSFNMVEPKIEAISFVRYTDTENHYEEAELACLEKLIEIVENNLVG